MDVLVECSRDQITPAKDSDAVAAIRDKKEPAALAFGSMISALEVLIGGE
jgi:hypothetical protein